MLIKIFFKRIKNFSSMLLLDEMSWNNKIFKGGTLGFFEYFKKKMKKILKK